MFKSKLMPKITLFMTVLISFCVFSCKQYIYEEAIYLNTLPSKTDYFVNEKLDLKGLSVSKILEDGSDEIITDYTVEPADGTLFDKAGEYTIEITYKEHKLSFPVKVKENVDEKIFAVSFPKNIYYINEKLDLSGLKMVALKTDGTTYEITDYECEPSDGSVLSPADNNKQTVKVIYNDLEFEFDVNVYSSFLEFYKNPVDSEFELYSETQKLASEIAVTIDGNLKYIWYRKNSNEENFTKIFESEETDVNAGTVNEVSLIVPQNDYLTAEYYCEAILSKNDEKGSLFINKYSDTVTVSQVINTGLPTVIINTENKQELVNKDDKINSEVIITDSNGVKLLTDDKVTFSGRGNTTWNQAKKPYKIKLNKKASLFGMPKHKQWMLIANYLDMSFMKNEMAFYLSEQLGMEWTVHGQYVDLIKNGAYVGLYWLGEQIKVDENRVNIDEENDFLFELDTYYDEVWKFKSNKGLPYMVKNDDDMTEEKLEDVKKSINEIESILYNENFPYTDSSMKEYEQSYKNFIDVESMAKFYLINEIMFNNEINHPKSCYFTFDTTNKILKAGPVWDFDWAGYSTYSSLTLKDSLYYSSLFKTVEFNEYLNELLTKLSTEGVSERISELKLLIKDAVILDTIKWGAENRSPVDSIRNSWNDYVDRLELCINTRLSSIQNMNFSTKFTLSE